MSTILAEGGPEQRLDEPAVRAQLDTLLALWGRADRRVLLVPPDTTRRHSYAGPITAYLYEALTARGVWVDVMPALGTHRAMSRDECVAMFGEGVPFERVLAHDWRTGVEVLGEVPAARLETLSGGRMAQAGVGGPVRVAVNRALVSGGYDRVWSIGQVLPHEVAGMSNYTKNLVVGLGGTDLIQRSHFLGAVCGMEQAMGRVDTPVRALLDEAFEAFVKPRVRVGFVQTVVEATPGGPVRRGLFAGEAQAVFTHAAALAQQVNITPIEPAWDRCVVSLDEAVYRSTWIGNKAIYRTRMAMAEGGELFVLAPGVDRFGEDPAIDALVRRFGYQGAEATLRAVREDQALRENLAAAAHLIHGSTEGRFKVTYCPGPGLSEADVRGVGYDYLPYNEAVARLGVQGLQPGMNEVGGRSVAYVADPGLGLWSASPVG